MPCSPHWKHVRFFQVFGQSYFIPFHQVRYSQAEICVGFIAATVISIPMGSSFNIALTQANTCVMSICQDAWRSCLTCFGRPTTKVHIKSCAVMPPNRTESFPGSTKKTSVYSPGCKHHVANHSYAANESAPEAVYRASFMQPKLFFSFFS